MNANGVPKKTSAKYDSLPELAYHSYGVLNSIMHEFQGTRAVYVDAENIGTVRRDPGSLFGVKIMCWNQLASSFYKLLELKNEALDKFDFFEPKFLEIIGIGADTGLARLRQMQHHIVDIKTKKFFHSKDCNPLMNEIYEEFVKYITVTEDSYEFMRILERNREILKEKFKDDFERFAKEAPEFITPKV